MTPPPLSFWYKLHVFVQLTLVQSRVVIFPASSNTICTWHGLAARKEIDVVTSLVDWLKDIVSAVMLFILCSIVFMYQRRNNDVAFGHALTVELKAKAPGSVMASTGSPKITVLRFCLMLQRYFY